MSVFMNNIHHIVIIITCNLRVASISCPEVREKWTGILAVNVWERFYKLPLCCSPLWIFFRDPYPAKSKTAQITTWELLLLTIIQTRWTDTLERTFFTLQSKIMKGTIFYFSFDSNPFSIWVSKWHFGVWKIQVRK